MLNLNRPSNGSVQQSRDHGESMLNDSPVVERYLKHYDPVKDQEDTRNGRLESSKEISNMYYDLVTDFYEYGWGHSFHFAVIRPGESREHSLAKYEYSVAMKLELKPGELVLVSPLVKMDMLCMYCMSTTVLHVHSIACPQYCMSTVLHVHSIVCLLYCMSTVLHVYCIACLLYCMFTVLHVYCPLYCMYIVLHVYCIACML